MALYSRKDRQESLLVLHFTFTSYSHIRRHTENLGVSQKLCFHVAEHLFPKRTSWVFFSLLCLVPGWRYRRGDGSLRDGGLYVHPS